MLKEFQQAFEHLKKDEVMKTLIKKVGNAITLYDRTEKDRAKAIAQARTPPVALDHVLRYTNGSRPRQ